MSPPCDMVHLRWATLCSQPPQPLRKSPQLTAWLRNCVCSFLGTVGICVGDDIHAGSWKVFAAVTVAEVCQL